MASIFDIPLPPTVEQLVSELAADDDVRALAAPQEFELTRGGYGRYMSALSQLAAKSPLAGSDRANLRIWAVILDRAGANRQGLLDALRICEG